MKTALRSKRGSKKDYYRNLKDLYMASDQPPASIRTMLRWAKTKGFAEPPAIDEEAVHAREMARALREELEEDPQGRIVRKNHCYRKEVDQGDGTFFTESWGTFETLSRDEVQASLQQRRTGAYGSCRQIKTDAESFNQNHNRGKMIQLNFNFEDQMLEDEMPTTYDGIKG